MRFSFPINLPMRHTLKHKSQFRFYLRPFAHPVLPCVLILSLDINSLFHFEKSDLKKDTNHLCSFSLLSSKGKLINIHRDFKPTIWNKVYSAFANSCPLQTNTFLFSIIHSHQAQLSSNKFQSCYARFARIISRMGYPHEVTFKVKLAIIKTPYTHTHICMCFYIISVAYTCRIIFYMKRFTMFYHIPHKDGMPM